MRKVSASEGNPNGVNRRGRRFYAARRSEARASGRFLPSSRSFRCTRANCKSMYGVLM